MDRRSIYRMIKAQLKLLESQARVSLGRVKEILYTHCDYKTSNALPPVSELRPYDVNGSWGTGKDSHAWFYFKVEAHPELGSDPLLLSVLTDKLGWDASNPQFIAYVDGEIRQGLDTNHTEVWLDPSVPHEVYLYAYTGQGISAAKLNTKLIHLFPQVEKLWYDIAVPFESLEYLDEESRDYSAILYSLADAMGLLDLLMVPSEEFYASVERALAYMEEEFYGKICGTDSAAPTVVGIGHTHIDCAWKWTLKQTREKVQRSFGTVLELMRRYPEYRFMSSQAFLYQNLKEEAPELYEQVKERIREGRWECEGAMWVEADCNLSSGESLVRQVMYGKRYFKQEFGVENRVLWLPDVFGYSAALPQILKKSGVDWFVTSKISWNDVDQMPYDTFDWQGIDGTRIHSYFLTAQKKKKGVTPERHTTYVAMTDPSFIAGTDERYQQKELGNETLLTFGFGDGGGGPTVKHLEQLRRLAHASPGTPKTEIGYAGDFLTRLEKRIEGNKRLPVWQGELYLEFHRGTYTSIYKNKKNNRKCEFLYMNTEWLSSLGKLLLGRPFPKAELHRGWEMLLTNQFHDIIPGSSIGEVYDQSDKDYAEIRSIATPHAEGAISAITAGIAKDSGYVVFNPNPFVGRGAVTVAGVTAYVENVPAKGYATIKDFKTSNAILVGDRSLENAYFRLTFNDAMQLTSLYDKRFSREVLKAGEVGNELRAYPDYPDRYDAWEWTEYSRAGEYRVITDVQSVEPVSDGIRAGLRIVHRHMHSTVTQTIWLYDGVERIDFDTDVDFHEKHQMLKVAFPVDILSNRATYEIQYGTVERPTHMNTSWDSMRFEVCAHKYADLSEGNYGVSLLNDCKYGYDIHDGVMVLSLQRSPTDPYPDADQGQMTCVYSLMPHSGAFDAVKTSAEAYALNNPMIAMPATGESSTLPERFGVLECDRENILCEVVKEAEDSEETVLRLYEIAGAKTEAKIRLGFAAERVVLTDLLENETEVLPVEDNAVTLTFSPFEIHTLRVRK